MKFRKFTLVVALLASASWLKAQELSEYKNTSVGLHLGTTKSFTDITQYSYLPTLKNKADIQYGLGLHVKRSLTSVFGLQFSASYNRLQGVLRPGGENSTTTDVTRLGKLQKWFGGAHNQGVYYNTNLFTVGIDAHLNFSNIDMHYRPGGHRKMLYYMVGGYHYGFFKSEIKSLATDAVVANSNNQNGTRVEQGSSSGAIVRVGLGVRRNINSKIDIGLEFTGNQLSSKDDLDGMVVGASSRDRYGLGMITVNYKLAGKAGADADLIDWRNPGKEIYEDMEAIKKRIDSLDSKLDNSIATADSDGDGIFDSVDKEPYSPFGAKVDASGKGIDSDGDGVFDGLDKEPNTPAGKLVNFQGIEIKMPEAPTTTVDPSKNGGGMGSNADVYFPSIFFDTNSAKVRAYDLDKLVRIASALQKNTGLKIRLIGHADVRGGTEFNQSLSQKRAEAVKEYLVKNLGVDASKIVIESKGESSPMSPSVDSINRRVDISGQ